MARSVTVDVEYLWPVKASGGFLDARRSYCAFGSEMVVLSEGEIESQLCLAAPSLTPARLRGGKLSRRARASLPSGSGITPNSRRMRAEVVFRFPARGQNF